eukprot:ANDGO_08263.mRNA.1 hypothetical protein
MMDEYMASSYEPSSVVYMVMTILALFAISVLLCRFFFFVKSFPLSHAVSPRPATAVGFQKDSGPYHTLLVPLQHPFSLSLLWKHRMMEWPISCSLLLHAADSQTLPLFVPSGESTDPRTEALEYEPSNLLISTAQEEQTLHSIVSVGGQDTPRSDASMPSPTPTSTDVPTATEAPSPYRCQSTEHSGRENTLFSSPHSDVAVTFEERTKQTGPVCIPFGNSQGAGCGPLDVTMKRRRRANSEKGSAPRSYAKDKKRGGKGTPAVTSDPPTWVESQVAFGNTGQVTATDSSLASDSRGFVPWTSAAASDVPGAATTPSQYSLSDSLKEFSLTCDSVPPKHALSTPPSPRNSSSVHCVEFSGDMFSSFVFPFTPKTMKVQFPSTIEVEPTPFSLHSSNPESAVFSRSNILSPEASEQERLRYESFWNPDDALRSKDTNSRFSFLTAGHKMD